MRRFIPARAGNTRYHSERHRPLTVHPRSRGEHGNARRHPALAHGSSPLARGTRTPSGWRSPGITVHPRSRGEHVPQSSEQRERSGSSPLARGTLDAGGPGRAAGRFIPARAGNTKPGATTTAPSTVHPRSRGEHGVLAVAVTTLVGSSPLARGTPTSSPHHERGQRFIPARAGNTSITPAVSGPSAVHPRSRGEHPKYHWKLLS